VKILYHACDTFLTQCSHNFFNSRSLNKNGNMQITINYKHFTCNRVNDKSIKKQKLKHFAVFISKVCLFITEWIYTQSTQNTKDPQIMCSQHSLISTTHRQFRDWEHLPVSHTQLLIPRTTFHHVMTIYQSSYKCSSVHGWILLHAVTPTTQHTFITFIDLQSTGTAAQSINHHSQDT